MLNRSQVILVLVLVIAMADAGESQMKKSSGDSSKGKAQIVFVCEHGAALSVVSAAYFNKIAKEKQLNLHAIARGTEPQKDLSVSARQGLNTDKVPFEPNPPQRLSTKDAMHARRIVAFCPLPRKYHTLAPVETWNDVPPTGENYARARDAILTHLQKLIQQLESDGTKP